MNPDPFIEHLISKHHCPAYIDEVGVSCIFGELVACAITIPKPFRLHDVDDSKKLKHEVIYDLARDLRRMVLFSFGIVKPGEIRKIRNMVIANKIAMKRALRSLPVRPDAVFIDGCNPPRLKITNYPIIKGDAKVFGIAVASILAKDFRDHLMMKKYGTKYSRYRIMSNKGYRSPDHLMAIRKWGVVPEHREYMPQVQKALSGGYDEVIQRKYKNRWEIWNT